jgi:outer membrane immunogenic protein
MRKSFIVFAVLALGSPSYAADMFVKAPPAPTQVYGWAGFYVGGNAGYAWEHTDLTSNFSCPTGGTTCPYFSIDTRDLTTFSNSASGGISARGITGGGQVGYNLQAGGFVYGIETDFNALNLSASRSATGVAPGGAGQTFTSSASVSTDWLYTFRGRLGWTVTPTTMVYATGGLAVTDLKVSNSFADDAGLFFGGFLPNIVGASSTSTIKTGYVAGAGIEWALNRNWTVGAEYLYVDFGPAVTTLLTTTGPLLGRPNPNAMATSSGDISANIIRGAINYRFN